MNFPGYICSFLVVGYCISASASPALNDSLNDYREKARNLLEVVKSKDRYIEVLSHDMEFDLPVGIRKNIGNLEYTIIIDSIDFTPQGAFLNAYMSLNTPQGKEIAFRGSHIRLTKDGGLGGDARLQLLGNYDIPVSDQINFRLSGEGTYVIWDCDGYRGLSLKGAIEFSRKLILPEDNEGNILAGNVSGDIQLELYDWSELVTTIHLERFQVPALPGFGFKAEEITVDLSDISSSLSMRLPSGYDEIYGSDYNELWQGVFIREVSVAFPPFFNKKGERISMEANELLIDELGVTGQFTAENILEPDSGSLAGWKTSIDETNIDLFAGSLTSATINGRLHLPMMGAGQYIGYEASISESYGYSFLLESSGDVKFPAWKAGEVVIGENSTLDLLIDNSGNATILALLNGSMSITAGLSENGDDLKIEQLDFRDLEISSQKPFIRGGIFSLGSREGEERIGNFPLHIEDIGFSSVDENSTAIHIKALISFTRDTDGGFGASSSFRIVTDVSDGSRWRFDRLQLDEAVIDIDGGAFSLYGSLAYFEKNDAYGKGYEGEVEAYFEPGIDVAASAMFGNNGTFRYWYADATASMPNGVPVMGGIALYGFGGGAYYHMKPELKESTEVSSHISYVPDETMHFGFRAAVNLGTHPSPNAFNAEASLEMAFNNSGGINSIFFKGTANFMETPDELNTLGLQSTVERLYGGDNSSYERGQISGDLMIHYDGVNKSLHGNLDVYVNAAGGLIRGSGQEYLAGSAVLHFDPSDWYIYIGTPENRIGVEIGIDQISVASNAYFMAGTRIHSSPPPPEAVSTILGASDLDYMRDLNALGSAEGFAFGAGLTIDTGDKRFLIFYGHFKAGLGFDLMLKNYGEDIVCAGRDGALGINGWYANGQAYAYFQGAIGIDVDLPFASGQYKIMDIGAAVLLQAKLPNPVWFRGTVGGYYEILNGLIQGNCRFQVTIGEKCDFSGETALDAIEVIAAITPVDGAEDVNVFTSPQVVFNVPVSREFDLTDLNNKRHSYKIVLDKFEILHNGIPIPGDVEFNSEYDVAAFKSYDIFPSLDKLRLNVRISFHKMENGVWRPLLKSGRPQTESRSITFTTGNAPDHIPRSNIAFSYPVIDQLNYYPGLSDKGYIMLKKGQPGLFGDPELWKHTARFSSEDGHEIESMADYQSKTINFQIPSGLKNSTPYQISLVSIPKVSAQQIDINIEESYEQALGDTSGMTSVRVRSAEEDLITPGEKLRLNFEFRSSAYSSIREKLADFSFDRIYRMPTSKWNVHRLKGFYLASEYFDRTELQGSEFSASEPLINLRADLDNNPYYNEKVFPLVYEGYPLDGDITVGYRNTGILGLPPVESVMIDQDLPTAGSLSNINWPEQTGIIWDLIPYMEADFDDIQTQVVVRYLTSSDYSDRIRSIIANSYPVIQPGDYDLIVEYILPGKDEPAVRFPMTLTLPEVY